MPSTLRVEVPDTQALVDLIEPLLALGYRVTRDPAACGQSHEGLVARRVADPQQHHCHGCDVELAAYQRRVCPACGIDARTVHNLRVKHTMSAPRSTPVRDVVQKLAAVPREVALGPLAALTDDSIQNVRAAHALELVRLDVRNPRTLEPEEVYAIKVWVEGNAAFVWKHGDRSTLESLQLTFTSREDAVAWVRSVRPELADSEERAA